MIQIGRNQTKRTLPKRKTQVLQIRHAKDPTLTWKWFQETGAAIDNKYRSHNHGDINGVWSGQSCYIIGAGPSLKEYLSEAGGFSFFKNKNTIVINHVVEDFDQAKILFFLDQRFLQRTKYDIRNFPGRIVCQNTTGLPPGGKVTNFKTVVDYPRERIEKGLFSPNFSGLAALNLAIVTGASPIYLFGFDNGAIGSSYNNYHYKPEYTGEVKKKDTHRKFKRVLRFFDRFKSYKTRIVQVTNGVELPFRKMKVRDFVKKNTKKHIITSQPKIIHLSHIPELENMGELSREIMSKCIGNHFLIDCRKPDIPEADHYIIEHFQGNDKFVKTFPHKNKATCLVHTVGCIPSNEYKTIVALTHSWKRWLDAHNVRVDRVIYGGIDLSPYKDVTPNYSGRIFGRITRWSPSKIHPAFGRYTKEILEKVPESICKMFVQFVSKANRKPPEDSRIIYDQTCRIADFKGNYLKELSVYTHVNGSFKETLSHAVIEAMATGLPIVYLREKTGVIDEVTGAAGIGCDTVEQVRDKMIKLLLDDGLKIKYGTQSKERAKRFCSTQMVEEWNEVIKESIR